MRNFIYLKNYTEMSAQEKIEYLEQFQNWSAEDYPKLCAIGTAWEEANIKSFDHGLQLLSAFSEAHDFIESALRDDCRRRVARIQDYINLIRKKTNLDKIATRQAGSLEEFIAEVPPVPKVDAMGNLMKQDPATIDSVCTDIDKRRPQHLEEYQHLLSPELQSRISEVSSLRASFASYSELAKSMYAQGCPPSEIEKVANKAKAQQEKLAAIYDDCDKEYDDFVKKEEADKKEQERLAAEKAAQIEKEAKDKIAAEEAGDTNLDATQEEKVEDPKEDTSAEIQDEDVITGSIETESEATTAKQKPKGSYTKAEIDAMEEGEFKGECKAARISANQSYIVRKDIKNKSLQKIRIQELLDWSIPVSQEIIDAAENQ